MRLSLISLMAFVYAGSMVAPVWAAKAPQPVSAVVDPTIPIQPLLQVGSQLDPKSTVRVIIQKSNPLADADDIAKSAKAKVVEELSVIPAFTATLKYADVMALATNPAVRYVSIDAVVKHKSAVDTTRLLTTYPQDVAAPAEWNAPAGSNATGLGVTVAVVDTGLDLSNPDFHGNASAVSVNATATGTNDGYGHGTHVAGIIAGNNPNGQYIGVAPNARVIGVKIADNAGNAYESDLLRGLGWVYLNKDARHIGVVNLSVGTSVSGSYAYSPTDAAVEHLWNSGITVVVAAGNLGNVPDAVSYAPANDPYVITVGCLDDHQTGGTPADDSLCPISSRGITQDGIAKPDVVAPGRKVVSALAAGNPVLAQQYPDRITADRQHIRLSGTSMSAPVVSGLVALLLERYPNLTPNQIKNTLTASAVAYPGEPDHAGQVNAVSAMARAASAPTNNSAQASLPGFNPAAGFGSVLWDGSRWSSATWDGSRWSNAIWDGSRWSNAIWDGSRWSTATWDGSRWSNATWDGSRWSTATWDGSRWSSTHWDGSRWSTSNWDGSRWSSANWDGSRWSSTTWDSTAFDAASLYD